MIQQSVAFGFQVEAGYLHGPMTVLTLFSRETGSRITCFRG